jgi:acetylornithine deacetylase/succinyl-diaminopimelate desuccinylase-like protein
LVELLAGLRDDQGRITIPGFYDQVIDMSAEERQEISFTFDPADYQQQTGACPVGGEKDYTPLERAGMRPTLEINGIHGGYTGRGFKTVIPAKAHAKISCRLVSDQEPAQIGELVAAYLKSHAPAGVQVSVHVHAGQGEAVRVSSQVPVVKSFAKAYEEVFGRSCEFILTGGSIPIGAKLAEACGGEMIVMGLGLDSDLIHAPNEHFGLDRIEKGILIMARAIENLVANRE